MRTLLRLVLILVLVAAVAYAFTGYWPGWSEANRTVGSQTPDATTGTSGRIDREAVRERGAEVGERVAVAGAQVADAVSEASVTGKIKAKMALDDRIRAAAIDVTTSGSTVTLSGRVASAAERERAVQLARETEGVTQVIDRLSIR